MKSILQSMRPEFPRKSSTEIRPGSTNPFEDERRARLEYLHEKAKIVDAILDVLEIHTSGNSAGLVGRAVRRTEDQNERNRIAFDATDLNNGIKAALQKTLGLSDSNWELIQDEWNRKLVEKRRKHENQD
jgi:hypothetical protein